MDELTPSQKRHRDRHHRGLFTRVAQQLP